MKNTSTGIENSSYLTAEQAKELTATALDINGVYKRRETEEVLIKIRDMATAGRSDFCFGLLDDIIIRRLKSLGYTVTIHSDQREGTTTTVIWR